MIMVTDRRRYFIGIDGGGTRCRLRIRDDNGIIHAEAEGGPANIHSDFDGAVKEIQKVLAQGLKIMGAGQDIAAHTKIGIGLAGLITHDDPARIKRYFEDYHTVIVESDALTACLGAHRGHDGALVIAGTGSAGVMRIGGKVHYIGGRGFRLGDDGSAARIGWDALHHTLLATDDLGPSSPLTACLLKKFDHDPAAITRFSVTANGADYGALAPLVFQYATKGDEVALPIIKYAARALIDLAHALKRKGAHSIALTGGLVTAIRPWIALEGPDPFITPRHDACDGAILLVGGALP